MTLGLVVAALPSLVVAYLMVCRLNARKWSFWSFEAWAYLTIMGGAIFTFYTAFGGQYPTMGKLLLDIGLCLYFGERSLRIGRWQKWHSH